MDRCFRKARPGMFLVWHSRCHSAQTRSAGLNARNMLAHRVACAAVSAVVWSLSRVRFLVQSSWDDRHCHSCKVWKTRLPLRLSPAPARVVGKQGFLASCRSAVDSRVICARFDAGLVLGHPISIASCSNLNSSCEGSHRDSICQVRQVIADNTPDRSCAL